MATRPKEFTVGEIAARTGVAVSALHFYERKGLIRSHRTSGNQRRYDRDVLRRLAVIRLANELGTPLKRVADAMATLPQGRAPTKDDWQALSAGWKDELDRRIVLLTRLRDELEGCIGCGCLSMDRCPLFNPDDELAREGAGPRRLLRDGSDVNVFE
jgi:MerR family transcriptional regulator, redox-sensitive transcriptional activator SoxR